MTSSKETPLKHSKWIDFENKHNVLFICSLFKVNSLECFSKPFTIIQRETLFQLGEDIPKGKYIAVFKIEAILYFCTVSFQKFELPSGPAVKNPSTKQETWIQSLDQENPLEEGVATHSSILRGSHGLKSLVGYSLQDHKESDMTEATEHNTPEI